MTILFSTKDPLGDKSNVTVNFHNHYERNTYKQDAAWGTNEHLRLLFPRGKVYDRLYQLQFDSYLNEYW